MMTRTDFALATVLVLSSGVVVYGQVDRANLNGTVTDSSRAVAADARVELVSRETGLKRVVETGPTGVYIIAGLPIGTYDLYFAVQFRDAWIDIPGRGDSGSLGQRGPVVIGGENLLNRCLHVHMLSYES